MFFAGGLGGFEEFIHFEPECMGEGFEAVDAGNPIAQFYHGQMPGRYLCAFCESRLTQVEGRAGVFDVSRDDFCKFPGHIYPAKRIRGVFVLCNSLKESVYSLNCMLECTGEAHALALIRERMLADIDLFNNVLDARDDAAVPRLKLRMAAIVCGIRSPFLDNSLERINLVRHFKEIRSRARALSFGVLPEISCNERLMLLQAPLAILLGLLFAECVSSGLSFDVRVSTGMPSGLQLSPCDSTSEALTAFVQGDPFPSSLLSALGDAGVCSDTMRGLSLSWEGNVRPVFARGLLRG